MDQAKLFKWRHFEGDFMVLCVRWYLRYSLSYRDLEEMIPERGLKVVCRLLASSGLILRWLGELHIRSESDALSQGSPSSQAKVCDEKNGSRVRRLRTFLCIA